MSRSYKDGGWVAGLRGFILPLAFVLCALQPAPSVAGVVPSVKVADSQGYAQSLNDIQAQVASLPFVYSENEIEKYGDHAVRLSGWRGAGSGDKGQRLDQGLPRRRPQPVSPT